MRLRRFLVFVAVLLAVACAYPRRTTSLSPVRTTTESVSTPADVWSLTVAGATVPPRNRGALAWDGSDGLPDAYVRIYRDEQLIWESDTIDDSLSPAW